MNASKKSNWDRETKVGNRIGKTWTIIVLPPPPPPPSPSIYLSQYWLLSVEPSGPLFECVELKFQPLKMEVWIFNHRICYRLLGTYTHNTHACIRVIAIFSNLQLSFSTFALFACDCVRFLSTHRIFRTSLPRDRHVCTAFFFYSGRFEYSVIYCVQPKKYP